MADASDAIEFSPQSTAIGLVKWRPVQAEADVGTLTVVFVTGRSYHHEDVPRRVAEEFRDTESAGTYYNTRIRGSY
jgi:hypothetical protein